jgi:hypothetical protein
LQGGELGFQGELGGFGLLGELLPERPVLGLAACPLLGTFPRSGLFLGLLAGKVSLAPCLDQDGAQALQLLVHLCACRQWIGWWNEGARCEALTLAKRPVKPNRELAGELEAGERVVVAAGVVMGGLVAGDANLVEEVEGLARYDPVGLQASQELGLGLVG